MSLILGKYKCLKRIGRGAYSHIYLIEDEKGDQLAIKMVNKEIIEKEPYLTEYF